MISCFEVRYRGEIADMELIRKAYRVNDYIETMEERDRATGERDEDIVQNIPVAEPEIFPRLYRILDKVQERLGISFPYEVRLAKIRLSQIMMVAKETGRNDLLLQFVVTPEIIATYDDDELAFMFGYSLGWEIWGFAKFSSLERWRGAADRDHYAEGESVLPGMGNALYKRWSLKAKISADRMGAIAAGGFEPSVKALLRGDAMKVVGDDKVQLMPLRSSDMCIPGIRQFLEFENRRGAATPNDGIVFRVRALCLFCEKWHSPQRGDEDLRVVDEILDNDFRKVERRVDTKEENERVMAFLALSILMLTHNGRKPSAAETRAVVSKLYEDFADNPSELFECGVARIVDEGMRVCRRIARQKRENLTLILYADLCSVAAVDGRDSDEKNLFLEKVAKELGMDARTSAALRLTAPEKDGSYCVDPLADELVAGVKAKFNGRRTKDRARHVVASGDASMLYRYGGDIEGECILRDIYHADALVKSYASFSTMCLEDAGRVEALKGGIRLTRNTSPRVYGIVRRVANRLGVDLPFEVFCKNDSAIAASARYSYSRGKVRGIVLLSSGAIEFLDDNELAFVVGHELGHLLHEHGRWGALEKDVEDGAPPETVLPQMGEIAYRKWQQKQEISADRAGAIAAGDTTSAVSALVKVCYGLSSTNFNADGVDELLGQIREVKNAEAIEVSSFETHPLEPLRIKALRIFSEAYCSDALGVRRLEEIDREIASYYRWIRRYPRKKAELAVMHAFADGGVEMLLADGSLDEREIARICFVLNCCTDEPEAEFIDDAKRRRARLDSSVRTLRKEEDSELNGKLLGQLVVLALSDGSISELEHRYLLKMAKRIGYDMEDAHKLISDKVAEVGFPVDELLEEQVRQFVMVLHNKCIGKKNVASKFVGKTTRRARQSCKMTKFAQDGVLT